MWQKANRILENGKPKAVVNLAKNRDRLSIIAAILEAASSGATKTRIMFRANLSFKLLEKYLDAVIGADFVKLDESNYQLTDRGRGFLHRYRIFHERITNVQKLLETLGEEYERLQQICESSQ